MTTQFASASYQEIIDLHTETGKVSVLGIHTPVTDAPYTFLQGFFDAFQKYRYDGCSMALVPAARLPADPSQVSYEGGDQIIDPRDLLNPILWHGAHGESLGAVLNQFYSAEAASSDILRFMFDSGELSRVSATQLGNNAVWESLYYRALTDNSWKKAHPQSGFRLGGLHPLVYSLGTNKQYLNGPYGSLQPTVPHRGNAAQDPDENGTLAGLGTSGSIGPGTSSAMNVLPGEGLQSTTGDTVTIGGNRNETQFFSERLHRLGWLDTRVRTFSSSASQSVVLTGDEDDDNQLLESLYNLSENVGKVNYLPRLFMGICLLPPAYKAEQYYRLILNHKFSFRKFRGLSYRGDRVGRFGAGVAPSYNIFD